MEEHENVSCWAQDLPYFFYLIVIEGYYYAIGLYSLVNIASFDEFFQGFLGFALSCFGSPFEMLSSEACFSAMIFATYSFLHACMQCMP